MHWAGWRSLPLHPRLFEITRLTMLSCLPTATDEAIASLPLTWDAQKHREAADHPLEARRYAELATTLASLSARRREARERVERLRRMAALLVPFESSDENTAQTNDET